MHTDKDYRTPRIVTLEAKEVVASLGPASAGGSVNSVTSGGGTVWGDGTGFPMG